MTRIVALAALLAAVAAAPAQGAATLRTARSCYAESVGRVAWSGAGWAPRGRVAVRLDGRSLATVTASPTGELRPRRFPAPAAGRLQRTHRLTATDGTSSASASFRTSIVSTALTAANPSGSRVRFVLRGFGAEPPAPAFLHYLRPGGGARANVSLGTPVGPCGTLVSRPRALFPFRAGPGLWSLRFDLAGRYSRRTPPPAATLTLPVLRLR